MAYEYIVNGKLIKLPVDPNRIAVCFREPSAAAERRASIEPKPEVGSFEDRFEVPNEKLTIIDVSPSARPGAERVAAAAGALNDDPAVERVVPVFDLDSKKVVATDRIMVGFRPEVGERAVEIINQQGGEVLSRVGEGDEYVVSLPPAADPFDVVAELMKRPEVAYAEPDFITLGIHRPREIPPAAAGGAEDEGPNEVPGVGPGENPGAAAVAAAAATTTAAAAAGGNGASETQTGTAGPGAHAPKPDPLLQFQYAVRLTRASDAWKRVTASRNIRVAILDEGVDINHPDLRAAIAATFDAVDGDGDQQPNPWDAHGTACAGLAAALPDNGRGIRGIAGGCSLAATRIAYSPQKGARWVSKQQDIVAAIDWAWRNGADILSNSWGGGAPSNAITNAFERARTRGRGGKGCVVIIAAGNDSGPVSFPGTLTNALTVSASNEFDEPKTKSSADGETWWGSNFGPEVDVAAPGVHNYTTDIVGASGYNDGGTLDGDYVANFNGTSSATPLVAGVAALVLSANPNLREAQVRRLLKQTADKVGQVVYANGRNDQMGDGRVNALRAVEAAPTFV